MRAFGLDGLQDEIDNIFHSGEDRALARRLISGKGTYEDAIIFVKLLNELDIEDRQPEKFESRWFS